ncbi:metallophosphoesterase [Azomonas macrocytogenes]|uniref:Calcineurin-like phosphoesterase domain-containing protein n=1 Tax=Azomonas macrocytogenes TaxID=69962 RepID=A0A839SYH9_AZOMA|nr:metallophosphoesterase [Azomonas macrocytogenes]MBB3102182.1 hypothetical protein [Azomonas macrocytogenes]
MLLSRVRRLSILLVLHLLIGFSLIPSLDLPPLGQLIGWALLVVSSLLVPLGFQSRNIQKPWLAWVSLLTMGVFSSLAVFSLLRLVLLGILLPFGEASAWAHGSAVAVLVIVAVVSLFGVFNARRLARVKEVEIALPGLPEAFSGFSIVQLSDIHVGPTIKHDYIERIVQRVNGLDPDFVAITGDLVDGTVAQLSRHIAPLGALRGRHGVAVVTGNHEYYAGALQWIDELRRIGLSVLLNEHLVLQHDGAELVIAGVTDYSAGRYFDTHRSDPLAALVGAPEAARKILLAHQPRSAHAALEAGFDLQLCGHTHGGQFWPWVHFVRLQQPWVAGIQQLGKLKVYISRGTGYWGPPIRFAAPAEITHIRLIAA